MNDYFIAVNYNNSQYTKKYVESIEELEGYNTADVKIIIVDNASRQEDVFFLESFCKERKNVTLIKSKENLGYFGGLNLGLDFVEDKKNNRILIGNNDLEFDGKFLVVWKALKLDSDVMVVCPRVTTIDGHEQNPHVIEKVSGVERFKARLYFQSYYLLPIFKAMNKLINTLIQSLRNNQSSKHPEYDSEMYIKRGIGACYILTSNFFENYDRLDDSVFLWGEEVLLSSQVEDANGKILYLPRLKLTHHESVSVSKIPSKQKYNILKESYSIYKDRL